MDNLISLLSISQIEIYFDRNNYKTIFHISFQLLNYTKRRCIYFKILLILVKMMTTLLFKLNCLSWKQINFPVWISINKKKYNLIEFDSKFPNKDFLALWETVMTIVNLIQRPCVNKYFSEWNTLYQFINYSKLMTVSV